jgi:arsenate reductase
MPEGQPKARILFLCTHNACRSQMAEGWTRHLRADSFEAFSAGIEPSEVDPLAVVAMAEVGVDLSAHRSKSVDGFTGQQFDYIVTVCDSAREQCPFFPGQATRVHAGFDDPPFLARDAGTEEEALTHYRKVRDEIRAFVEAMPDTLSPE